MMPTSEPLINNKKKLLTFNPPFNKWIAPKNIAMEIMAILMFVFFSMYPINKPLHTISSTTAPPKAVTKIDQKNECNISFKLPKWCTVKSPGTKMK